VGYQYHSQCTVEEEAEQTGFLIPVRGSAAVWGEVTQALELPKCAWDFQAVRVSHREGQREREREASSSLGR